MCTHVSIYTSVHIERPWADTAETNPQHVTTPRTTPGVVGGSRNQTGNQSIVQAHFVLTVGVLVKVLEGSQGVSCGPPVVARIPRVGP